MVVVKESVAEEGVVVLNGELTIGACKDADVRSLVMELSENGKEFMRVAEATDGDEGCNDVVDDGEAKGNLEFEGGGGAIWMGLSAVDS